MGRKKAKETKSEYERSAKEQFVKVSDGSELCVLIFDKVKQPKEDIAIYFIPGMVTVFPRWEKVVEELNENYKVYYIESREKTSSKLVKKAEVTIKRISEDLSDVEKALGLDKTKYVCVASSLGGTQILENLATQTITPLGSVLVGPGVEFHYPRWLIFMFKITPIFFIRMVKPLLLFLLGYIWVDRKREPEQSEAYMRSIGEANPRKLREVIFDMAKYNSWDLLPKINQRLILVGASLDKVHEADFALRVANTLLNCTFVDLGSSKAAHDTPVVELTREFIKELTGEGPKIKEVILQPDHQES
ncbi:MAG: hypothetical protein HZR80_14195 [Candidatus Heimdallarchaeota archaeon]